MNSDARHWKSLQPGYRRELAKKKKQLAHDLCIADDCRNHPLSLAQRAFKELGQHAWCYNGIRDMEKRMGRMEDALVKALAWAGNECPDCPPGPLPWEAEARAALSSTKGGRG